MKATLVAMGVLFLAGCATARPPVPATDTAALDLAGTHQFSTMVQGMDVAGQMRFTGEPGSYEGAMYSELTGEVPFSYIETEGRRATLIAETPDGPVEIRLVFGADGTFTGSWALGAEGGSVRGTRVQR